jgi:hypothetical protein
MRRNNWTYSRICSHHFVSGKSVNMKGDIDYIPTVFVFKKMSQKEKQQINDSEKRSIHQVLEVFM